MTKKELLEIKSQLQEAMKNVLEGGEEFQTRNARVKQTSYETLAAQLKDVENQLAELDEAEGGRAMVTHLKFGGWN